ncbi:MAG: GTP pyrophosphokinase family protein, partial [Solobacterium sp.]|nr:GTP pyrophosphokinase family protein [Solobacterium sp.]
PIETIKTRIKSPDSIVAKLIRQGDPVTLESMEKNLFDVAGVRVICAFMDDIYRLEEVFLKQDDITLIRVKNYIEQPKPSGYRSLHLVVKTPIIAETWKKDVYVEVQMRTIAMDFWASLDHKLRYKKDIDPRTLERLGEELRQCAERSAALDREMQRIRKEILRQK